MATGRFVVYYRVSTVKQGRSGLGLAAQQEAVKGYLNGGSWRIVGELQEVESGKNRNRPQLAEALRLCRVHRATLLVAKQDRLSRNAAQIMGMLDDAKVPFVCVDDPNTTKLNVGIKALIAEDEADKASVRTKAALAVARTRGKQLGGQRGDWSVAAVATEGHKASLESRRAKAQAHKADLMPMIEDIQASGITSLLGIAAQLTERGAVTARGTEDNPGTWSAVQVKRILDRAALGPTQYPGPSRPCFGGGVLLPIEAKSMEARHLCHLTRVPQYIGAWTASERAERRYRRSLRPGRDLFG